MAAELAPQPQDNEATQPLPVFPRASIVDAHTLRLLPLEFDTNELVREPIQPFTEPLIVRLANNYTAVVVNPRRDMLGRGGLANVYRARVYNERGWPIGVHALKQMTGQYGMNAARECKLLDNFGQRFLEQRNEPSGLPLPVSYGAKDKCEYLVEQLAPGKRLDVLMAEAVRFGRSLPSLTIFRNLLRITTVLEGRDPASAAYGTFGEVVYHDFKPTNIFHDMVSGITTLLDPGIAVGTLEPDHLHREGFVTPVWSTPEQCAEVRDDIRTNVAQLGYVLVDLLTLGAFYNERMKDEPTSVELVGQTIAGVPGRIINELLVKHNIDRALQRIIRKATTYYPKDRYQSCAEMLADVEAYMQKDDPKRFFSFGLHPVRLVAA